MRSFVSFPLKRFGVFSRFSQASRSIAKFFTLASTGCSEHTGVDAEPENVSKHVRGDLQLGCVESR